MEACRLTEASKESLRHDEGNHIRVQKPVDRVFAVLREMVQNANVGDASEISMADAVRKCKGKGEKICPQLFVNRPKTVFVYFRRIRRAHFGRMFGNVRKSRCADVESKSIENNFHDGLNLKCFHFCKFPYIY